MSEEFALNELENEEFDNVVELHEGESTEEIVEGTETTEIELSQQPNAVFRRALLGGYKTVDVDKYTEKSKELLQTSLDENKQLKVKIDQLRNGSITMRTALATSLKFSENITITAKREASSLMESAHHTARRFEQESADLGSSLSQDIDALRLQRDRITSELNATMESHIRLLDTIDMNSLTEENRSVANTLLELG